MCKGPEAEKRKLWNYEVRSRTEHRNDVGVRLYEVTWFTVKSLVQFPGHSGFKLQMT